MKKGYIKTIEAVIAIVLILMVVYFVIPRNVKIIEKVPSNVKSSQEFIINEISSNKALRNCIIEDVNCENNESLISLVEENVPIGYNYTFKICDSTNCLTSTPMDKSVYMDDVFIASTLEEQKPKIFRIWMWAKG